MLYSLEMKVVEKLKEQGNITFTLTKESVNVSEETFWLHASSSFCSCSLLLWSHCGFIILHYIISEIDLIFFQNF